MRILEKAGTEVLGLEIYGGVKGRREEVGCLARSFGRLRYSLKWAVRGGEKVGLRLGG